MCIFSSFFSDIIFIYVCIQNIKFFYCGYIGSLLAYFLLLIDIACMKSTHGNDSYYACEITQIALMRSRVENRNLFRIEMISWDLLLVLSNL